MSNTPFLSICVYILLHLVLDFLSASLLLYFFVFFFFCSSTLSPSPSPSLGFEQSHSWQRFSRVAAGMDGEKTGGEKRRDEGSGFSLWRSWIGEERERHEQKQRGRECKKTQRCREREKERLSKPSLRFLCIPTSWLRTSVLQCKAKIWFCRPWQKATFWGNLEAEFYGTQCSN